MNTKRVIPVFIASPGDLAIERNRFKTTIETLNHGFGDGMGVEFQALGWEDTLASTGRRNQGVINEDINRCEVFILCLHRRWGQETPDSPYSSYTEEEFHLALERFEKDGLPEIFVFFKSVDSGQMADAGPQLEKVLQFRTQLEESRRCMYKFFETEEDFVALIDRHLRAYAKDELPEVQLELTTRMLPLAAQEEIAAEKQRAEEALNIARQATANAELAHYKAEIMQLEFAEEAAEAALNGKVEAARQKFAKSTDGTTNLRVLFLAFAFYERTGDLNQAEQLMERSLALIDLTEQPAEVASAYGNLGIIYEIRGDLDKAEEYYSKALELHTSLDRKEGMASNYGNLGIIYEIRGDLDKAEEYYSKALELHTSLDRKEGMASNYGNLGIIYEIRGDLDKAEEYYGKALELNASLGRNEGMAGNYGNLGTIYKTRSDLDKAEEYYGKALELSTSLGHKQGMAIQYGNLGSIYQTQGDLDKAEEYYGKALELNTSLARKEGMAIQYGNLGIIYKTRGDLNKAEEHCGKALELNTSLDHKEGMASDYGNLGIIYQIRGDLDKAEEYYGKALKLNTSLGRKEGMASDYGNLGIIYQTRGDLDQAKKYGCASVALFKQIGAQPKVELVEGWLAQLDKA